MTEPMIGCENDHESVAICHLPCSVSVLDDEDVLEGHVPLHVRHLERLVLAADGRALVGHTRLMLHLKKKQPKISFRSRISWGIV